MSFVDTAGHHATVELSGKRRSDVSSGKESREAAQRLAFRWLLRQIASHPQLCNVKFEPDAWDQLQLLCNQTFPSAAGGDSCAPLSDLLFHEETNNEKMEEDEAHLPSPFYCTKRKERAYPFVTLENHLELRHHIPRLAASLCCAILSPPSHISRSDVLVYKKCRGSADAIRLLLNDQRVPYAEYHVEMEADRHLFRDAFSAAKLPENWPYFSDGLCEITGAGSIVRYLARKFNLMGRTAYEEAKLDAVIELGFVVLQALWKADCQCRELRVTNGKISRDRVRARFIRDTLFPLLGQLNRLAPLDYCDGAETGPNQAGHRVGSTIRPVDAEGEDQPSQRPPIKRWVFEMVIYNLPTLSNCKRE